MGSNLVMGALLLKGLKTGSGDASVLMREDCYKVKQPSTLNVLLPSQACVLSLMCVYHGTLCYAVMEPGRCQKHAFVPPIS